MQVDELRYLELLSNTYTNRFETFTEIINLQAILNLPKGTEHFISDLHGEYEAFLHLVNNCSGEIKEKVDRVFPDLSEKERADFCTLIYYPNLILEDPKNTYIDNKWYLQNIAKLIKFTSYLSSKYTRSKVRKAIPRSFNYIIDELMHAKDDEDLNRSIYHEHIFNTILKTGSAHHFVKSLCALAKRLAVDNLHVVGDIFDRGSSPDKIIDLLTKHHNVDIQWGNHDVLWMGAACGSEVCVAQCVRNTIAYSNCSLLEHSYGIALRNLEAFSKEYYYDSDNRRSMLRAITVILLKLEGQCILRNQSFNMADRLLLNKINYSTYEITLEGKTYPIKKEDLATVNKDNPYELTSGELFVINSLCKQFESSIRLQEQVKFLYSHGSMYKKINGNLLYHGCVPSNEDGTFATFEIDNKGRKGKDLFDTFEKVARDAFAKHDNQYYKDLMWYLWCGKLSPLSGRLMKSFEHAFIDDKKAKVEPRNPYYSLYFNEDYVNSILFEFNLDSKKGHIINGHTPIEVKNGESPTRANGKVLVIDGGFCKSYHNRTGIAGYTLIANSHGLKLKAHTPFEGVSKTLSENADIVSSSDIVETYKSRMYIKDTDVGFEIRQKIDDLYLLLNAYRQNKIVERNLDRK